MHDAVIDYVRQATEGLRPARVIDLGGRDVNGSPRHLFPDADYITVDVVAGPGVDVVADAATVELDPADLVLCTELLEHTQDGARIIANAWRLLRPGGVFVATMAGPGRAPHGAGGETHPPPGEWYRNVEPADLVEWLMAAGFQSFSTDRLRLDLRCTARREATWPQLTS